ncbi:hypothetical protein E2C01_043753 [Portunus trituberculatus]|uniref:Uncharacterized protein n=1 Tax=Portunus trituberculatus TaxID=210409 RepID=A0A5B7FYL1_PORTR|nr:hypothetical protein [Portunus trituberculatus]
MSAWTSSVDRPWHASIVTRLIIFHCAIRQRSSARCRTLDLTSHLRVRQRCQGDGKKREAPPVPPSAPHLP